MCLGRPGAEPLGKTCSMFIARFVLVGLVLVGYQSSARGGAETPRAEWRGGERRGMIYYNAI